MIIRAVSCYALMSSLLSLSFLSSVFFRGLLGLLFSSSLCLMFSLHLRLLQLQSVSSCATLKSLPPTSLNLVASLFFDPLLTLPPLHLCVPLCLRWESIFCHVVSSRPRWLHPPYVWLPETPEEWEHLAAEWVGVGVMQKLWRFRVMNMEMVGGMLSKSRIISKK